MEKDLIEQIEPITSFESMSNELLMELFGYYDLYSLFYSFNSLNSRLDNIIFHCQVHIDLDQVKSIDFVYFLSHILPKIHGNNIISFHATNSHQIAILAADKCLIYLKNLRSMSLKNTEIAIVQEMISRIDFSRLERVIFDRIDAKYVNNYSLFKHFVGSNRYVYLRTYKDKISSIEQVESSLPIKHVSLDEYVNPTNFFNFLNQCPDLKSLKITTDFPNDYFQPGYSLPILLYDTITHLDLIMFGYFNEQIIIYLFKNVSRVRRLKLRCFPRNCPQLVDPLFWEKSLSTYLVGLKRLYLDAYTSFNISSINSHWNHLLNEEEIGQKLEKSTYWSSHGWKPTFFIDRTHANDNHYAIRFAFV